MSDRCADHPGAGATYWQIPADLQSGPFDRVASLWFAVAVVVLQPAANASSIINMEKDILRRELSNGMYKFSSFYLAKGITSLPFQLTFALVFNVGVYFSVGYQVVAAKFFGFSLVMVLMMLISETMGMAAGAVHRNPTVGLILVSAVCLLLMMYTGFIQTHTPIYFQWLKKVRLLLSCAAPLAICSKLAQTRTSAICLYIQDYSGRHRSPAMYDEQVPKVQPAAGLQMLLFLHQVACKLIAGPLMAVQLARLEASW